MCLLGKVENAESWEIHMLGLFFLTGQKKRNAVMFCKILLLLKKHIILPARLRSIILACTELMGQKYHCISFVMGRLEWNENSLISAGYPTGDYDRQQINNLGTLLCFEQTLRSWRSVF